MSHIFRNALLASAVLHAAFFAPALWSSVLPDRQHVDDLVVDYVALREPEAIEVAQARPREQAETPRVEIKPKVEVPSAPTAPASKAASARDTPSELAKKQAKLQSTEDYISYYQLIREKIRQEVKRRYRVSRETGEVYLNFILTSDGRLSACEADRALSKAGRPLIDMADASVRSAAPFPPFPKALDAPRVAFSVTIVFKTDR